MSNEPALLYLEADDEITSVVRRVRAADAARVVVVAPGRSRATSSVVALRLLARAAEGEGREVALVGDALTRSLAADAGLPAYASVDDARRAAPVEAVPSDTRHAAIHVVRGRATDDTAPTLAAAPVAVSDPDATVAAPVARRPSRPARPAVAPAPRRRALPIALVGAVVALLVLASVAAATLLPGATITISPRTEAIGPVEYEIEVSDLEEIGDQITLTQTVTATGTAPVQVAASGEVVFNNWTFFPVEVPAGTYVAAGEQAFATRADVVVPRGRLTGQGTIAAGQEAVEVDAAAIGPAANVPAEAINTVVNEEIDQRLRGFPENPQPRVSNPEPTTGGVDTTVPLMTQADVDAALQALRAELAAQTNAALAEVTTDDAIVVGGPLGEPTIEGVEGLAETLDLPEAEISGVQPWQAFRVARADVVADARARFNADVALVPANHRLVEDAIEVTVGDARMEGERMIVPVTVTGRSVATLVEDEVRQRSVGRSADEAQAALADLGPATIELWPGWVTTVPTLDWRVEVRIEDVEAAGT